MERLSTENLPICCTSVSPGLNPPTASESSSFFHLSLSAHSVDEGLDSLHFSVCVIKKQQLKSVLQNQCHPHIWWFKSQLDSNSLTTAVVFAVVQQLCSQAEGRSMESQAGGLQWAWPLVLVSLIIDSSFIITHQRQTQVYLISLLLRGALIPQLCKVKFHITSIECRFGKHHSIILLDWFLEKAKDYFYYHCRLPHIILMLLS